MKLDSQQHKAVHTESKKALCLAGSGAGKTRCLVERISYLINTKKVSPSEILAFTFTRKSAGEMKTRLEKVIGKDAYGLNIGTIHSIALEYLMRFGEMIGLKPKSITIYSDWEASFLLKDIATELGVYKKSWSPKKKEIDKIFNHYYATGEEPDKIDPVYPLFKTFMSRCRENNSLTYGALLIGFKILFPKIKQYINIKHIFLDECQDTDLLQWGIINDICKTLNASLFIVGDIDQCQPAGTMVETLKGLKPIEDLDPLNDELFVYDKQSAMVYGGHNKGYKFIKSSRKYNGFMYTVEASGFKTRCTGNHKWQVKWDESIRRKETNVVYLMKKGNKFRMGWCQLFRLTNDKYQLHLSARMRLEKADSIWIIRIFNNKRDASIWESILSTKYGIPLVTFRSFKDACYYDKEAISQIFKEVGNIRPNAINLLRDHNLDINYPFHSIERNHQKRGGSRIFEMESCNMFSGMFRVPMRRDETRYINWEKATVSKKYVINETVYSLDVEKYHTYIADGLITKNSIYKFRGAVPEYLIENQDKFDIFKIETNYRSKASIVIAANHMIQNNTDRIDKVMVPSNNDMAGVSVKHDLDSEGIVNLCNEMTIGEPGIDLAVLSRNHILLRKMSSIMIEKGIKHNYVGKKSGLTNSEPFRRFHAFLKLIVNPFDNFSFLLIRDILGITRTEYSEIRLNSLMNGRSHFQEWMETEKDNQWVDMYHYIGNNLLEITIEAINEKELGFNTDDIVSFINYYKKTHKIGSTITNYLKWLATYDIQEDITEERDCIQLMTIHGSKGLEFKNVIIAGVSEDFLPSKRAINSDDIQEERRIAYVGWTRAEDNLIITTRPEMEISRFVKESEL